MSLSISMHVLCALAMFGPPVHPRVPGRVEAAAASDSVAIAAIVNELDAFYRDLDVDNPTSLVTHFYPAKVTARFAAPERDPRWLALSAPTAETLSQPNSHVRCGPRAALVLVGSWARVLARRSTGEIDELWLYRMSGRWKIIHLVFGEHDTVRLGLDDSTTISDTERGLPSVAP